MSYKIPHQIFGDHNKPVIFFLHGFMGQISDFNYFYQHLAENYQLVGISYPHAPTDFAEYCQKLNDFIKTFPTPRYLIGYSMGGRIALAHSFYYPDILKKQIIISAHPGIEDKSQRQLRLKSDQKLFDHVDEASWRQFLNDWYHQEIFGDIKNHCGFKHLIEKKYSELDYFKQCLLNFSLGVQELFWQQKTPTHFIVGAKDKKYLEIASAFISKNPNAKLSITQDAGHKCYFERPAELLQIMRDAFSFFILSK